MKTYSLINYFDVWGNEKDGYEVNNQCCEFSDLVITDDLNNKDLIKYLKTIGFFREKANLKTILVKDNGDLIEFFEKKTKKPLCALQLNY